MTTRAINAYINLHLEKFGKLNPKNQLNSQIKKTFSCCYFLRIILGTLYYYLLYNFGIYSNFEFTLLLLSLLLNFSNK